MKWYEALPHLNAALNSVSCVLLVCGYRAIRSRAGTEAERRSRHARLMLAAFGVSVLFLASYLTYHGVVGHTSYEGRGWVRPVYFFILITHIVLAAFVPILASLTLYFAARRRWAAHRKIARWTFPIWLYVSFTGVAVYLMLYVF